MGAVRILAFAFPLTLLAQTSLAAMQTFSVGGELAQLFVPNGMCVLSESAISTLHLQEESMGKNDIVAVFAPCDLIEGNSLTTLPDIWGMWLAQKQAIPRNISRRELLDVLHKETQQKTDVRVLGRDENAFYTAMQLTGGRDVVNAVIAITKLNNYPVTLNLYKTYSSSNPTNLLQLAKVTMERTIAEQPKEPQSSTEKVINKAVMGGAGGLLVGLFVAIVSLVAWFVTKIPSWLKKGSSKS